MILFHSLLRFRFLEAMDVASVERNATLTDHMTVFDFWYDRNSVMLRSGTGETWISLAIVRYLHCLDGVDKVLIRLYFMFDNKSYKLLT